MMTTTATRPGGLTMPQSDPTQSPAGPDRIELEVTDLRVTSVWDSGTQHDTYLVENGDLSVILKNGTEGPGTQSVPALNVETGHVVIALGIDGAHDQVDYYCEAKGTADDTDELFAQAIEALVACREAARRVRQA